MEVSVLDNEKIAVDNDYGHRFAEHEYEVHISAPSRGVPHASGSAGGDYDACAQMERFCRRAECGEPAEYARRATRIRANIGVLWNDDEGMFLATDGDCRQVDIWGSALAVQVGCTTDQQSDRISDYLIAHYDGIVQRGQVRHLPAGQTWEQLFVPIQPGRYQNGAFWATPVVWIAPTIARRDMTLAVKMVQDVIADYRQRGITECVNGDYHNVREYVVSATNVYGLVRKPSGP